MSGAFELRGSNAGEAQMALPEHAAPALPVALGFAGGFGFGTYVTVTPSLCCL